MKSRLTSRLIAFGHNPEPHDITSTSLCQTQVIPHVEDDIINIPSDASDDTDCEDGDNFELANVQIHYQPSTPSDHQSNPYDHQSLPTIPQPMAQAAGGYSYQFISSDINSEADEIIEMDTTEHVVPN